MKYEVKDFGKTKDGQMSKLYVVKNSKGTTVTFSDFGATIVGISTADRKGQFADIALGYDSVKGYEENGTYYGAFIGRNGNRIGDARFTLNGKTYNLEKNDGPNNLHSGFKCYNTFYYETEVFEEEDEITVEFSRLSPDMEQGFPGNLDMTVSYTLTEDDELVIEYYAISDQDTVMNFTNHTFFNLSGHDQGSVVDTEIMIDADHFTPTDAHLIPTGEIRSVEGTPMDFRKRTRMGDRIDADYEPLVVAGGYDHNYCLNNSGEECELVCECYDPHSGRKVEVFTDCPGMQLYAGNFIDGKATGKGGYVYKKREGFCLETQFYPDACNEKPFFKTSIVPAQTEFMSATIYKFSVEK